MSDHCGPHPRIIGDPPREVRPGFPLEADAVATMLTAESAPALLDTLGISGRDAEELLALLPRAVADAEILHAVTETAGLLRAGAGLDVTAADLTATAASHRQLQQRLAPGEGLIEILALLVSTSTVRAWHAARGWSQEGSWAVLADLGQQMRVHRLCSGRLGLHQLPWMALNWAGRLVQLGRLQFDLHRIEEDTAQERWVIGTHIPATGPLTPDAVDDSLAAATAFFREHFADLGREHPDGAPAFGHEFHCDSWLMSRVLVQELGSSSNLGGFADRWEILRSMRADDSAAFFVFHARPPYDPAALPRSTRLERLVGERLADGRGWEGGLGRLLR